ncbi:PKD domain-containing protein [Cellulomonas marina]|uniref:PKD domain-containing protein n=1 Tax=Cellulomonas marina TaxID=988821 RepID=UPI000B7FD033|nr:hypothetical protein [Cellulomonas marina]
MPPSWSRPAGSTGRWTLDNGWLCRADAAAVPVLTEADFRRLPLPAPTAATQPATGDVLVNMPLVLTVDPAPATLTTTLLGRTVEVQATPTSWTWAFGDGTAPLTTTSPGHTWPHADVTHTFTTAGPATVRCTTTWTGRYRVAGTSTWLDVQGTATTSADLPTRTVVERTAHLTG